MVGGKKVVCCSPLGPVIGAIGWKCANRPVPAPFSVIIPNQPAGNEPTNSVSGFSTADMPSCRVHTKLSSPSSPSAYKRRMYFRPSRHSGVLATNRTSLGLRSRNAP